MKKMVKSAGVILIVCAVLLFIVSAIVQEHTKPMKVTTGVIINGEFKATDSGYMGGNAGAKEDMGWLKGIAIMCGIAGAGTLIGSTTIKEEKESEY